MFIKILIYYINKKLKNKILLSTNEIKNKQISNIKIFKQPQKNSAEHQNLNIKKFRKKLWYEKFYWFISSENFLIIAGKDAQQNELLVKKYLNKNDLYIHCDVHGSSSVIIKNAVKAQNNQTQNNQPNQPNQPQNNHQLPMLTIKEAAIFNLCRSSAWKNNIIATAYWVYANQVSKTAPTGQYLTSGSFMIRGKKFYSY